MPARAAPRLPLAPLVARIEHDPATRHGPKSAPPWIAERNRWTYYEATPDGYDSYTGDAGGVLADKLAELAHVSRREAQRWISAGSLPEHHADRAAVELGSHPAILWPTEWAELAAATATA